VQRGRLAPYGACEPVREQGPRCSDEVRRWVRNLLRSTPSPSERGPSLHALRRWSSQPCSGASQVLLPRPTPRSFPDGFASSASRHGPEPSVTAVGGARSPRFRRAPFVRDVALDPGGATGPRISAPHMLPSTPLTVSASAESPFRGSLPLPTRSLCTLRRGRHRTRRNTRYQAGATPYLGRTFTGWITPTFLAHQWLARTFPYRRFADTLADVCARLGANVDRYSFIAVDLHHLLHAGLPAHPT
jgi:hypothetical protein